jgi:hypothetical protein
VSSTYQDSTTCVFDSTTFVSLPLHGFRPRFPFAYLCCPDGAAAAVPAPVLIDDASGSRLANKSYVLFMCSSVDGFETGFVTYAKFAVRWCF